MLRFRPLRDAVPSPLYLSADSRAHSKRRYAYEHLKRASTSPWRSFTAVAEGRFMPVHSFAACRVSFRNLRLSRRGPQALWKGQSTTTTSPEKLQSDAEAERHEGARSKDVFTFTDTDVLDTTAHDAASVCTSSLTLKQHLLVNTVSSMYPGSQLGAPSAAISERMQCSVCFCVWLVQKCASLRSLQA